MKRLKIASADWKELVEEHALVVPLLLCCFGNKNGLLKKVVGGSVRDCYCSSAAWVMQSVEMRLSGIHRFELLVFWWYTASF